MNIFLIILGMAAIIGVIVSGSYKIYQKSEYNKGDGKIYGGVVMVGLLLLVLGSSFVIIPTNHTGVKTTFGQVSETVLYNGFHFKAPFVDHIQIIDNRQIDKLIDNKIGGEASDKTEVFAEKILVTYQLNPDKSVYLYSTVANVKEIISDSILESAIREALVRLDADSVTNRGKIEPIAKDVLQSQLTQKYGDNVITILKVTIESMEYAPAYNDAIAQKQDAKIKAEQQKIENEKSIEKARSEIQVAEQEKQKAEIAKETVIINAEAEAEAYRIKSREITPELLKKWELDARMKHGWVTIQGGTPIVDTRE